jgi:hypothetical protein
MKPVGNLYVIVGLPGSGKTTLLKKWKKEGKIAGFGDDYQANYKKSRDPKDSPHYSKLIQGLAKEEGWAIADVRYCDPGQRRILAKTLRTELPALRIKYFYFENDPELCVNNALIRNRGTADHEKNLIYYYTNLYKMPKTGNIMRIHRV